MVKWFIAVFCVFLFGCSDRQSSQTDYRDWVEPLSKIQVILHEDLPDSTQAFLIKKTLEEYGKTVTEYEALLEEITGDSPEKGVTLIKAMEKFLQEEMKKVNQPRRSSNQKTNSPNKQQK